MSLSNLGKSICLTLSYADVFNYPLTAEEIYLRLQSHDKTSPSRVYVELEKLIKAKKIQQSDKYYYLKKQKNNIRKRQNSENVANFKKRRVLNLIPLFTQIPWLETVIITGSVAAGNAFPNDDIDILIICSPNRLWIVRLILNFVLELKGMRRKPNSVNNTDKVCLNILLENNYYLMPPNKQNLFTAHELMQSQCILDKTNIYRHFLAKNFWANKYLANWYQNKTSKILKKSQDDYIIYGSINRLIKNFLNYINFILYKLQLLYMKNKKTNELVTYHQVFFHPGHIDSHILHTFKLSQKSFS